MTAPSWWADAPPTAFAAVVHAAEHAAHCDGENACRVLAESTAEPRWLAIAAMRALAGQMLGDGMRGLPNQLRAEACELGAECGADTTVHLEAVSAAEAYAAGDTERLAEIVTGSEYAAIDFAAIAAQYCGQAVAYRAERHGIPTDVIFAAIRQTYGIGDA